MSTRLHYESGQSFILLSPLSSPNRSDLIDKEIERAVAHMQSVIVAGRYIRDQKVIPTKFPLPEVVVIHRNTSTHDDLKGLKNYILEVSGCGLLIISE